MYNHIVNFLNLWKAPQDRKRKRVQFDLLARDNKRKREYELVKFSLLLQASLNLTDDEKLQRKNFGYPS